MKAYPVSNSRIQRDQLISEAEGYLDLIVACAGHINLDEFHQVELAERALKTLGQLDEKSGRRAHVLFLEGQAYRLCDRFDKAVEKFEQSLTVDSNNIHAYLSLGWCFKRLGDMPSAINALEEALDVQPGSGIVNYNLACYWSLVSKPMSAVKFLSRAIELDHRFRDLVSGESDFDPIRNHPAFQAITTVIV
jgi:tetratricopeptide (TPR) repeat protein